MHRLGWVWVLGCAVVGGCSQTRDQRVATTQQAVGLPVPSLASCSSQAACTMPFLATGSHHTLVVQSDGSLLTRGFNNMGQLGDGTTTDRFTPVKVSSNVTAVAGGFWHSLAVKSDGTVWAWGNNFYGQLGNGTLEQSLSPVQVMGLTDVVAVAASSFTSFALERDGSVWAWGKSAIGDGTTTWR